MSRFLPTAHAVGYILVPLRGNVLAVGYIFVPLRGYVLLVHPTLRNASEHPKALPFRLPNELQSKLKLPVGGGGAADGVERGESGRPHREPATGVVLWICIHERVGHGKQRMVQDIKGFKSELQVHAL